MWSSSLYLQKNSCTDSCHDSTSNNITKIPASPQDELPILSTHEGSGDGIIEALPPPCVEIDEHDEVVLMAIISPARTIGRTKPELHFVSYRVSFFRVTYKGDRTMAETRASTMATDL